MSTTSRPSLPPGTRIPFCVVDEAVHLLDSEAAPWSIQLEVRVEGSLSEERLRGALAHALGRHPMARARKVPSQRSQRCDSWEIPPAPDIDPFRVVHCPRDIDLAHAREQFQSMGVPLVESPPFRVRLARHPGGDVLMFNFNHAATDGFGALRVLRSMALHYAGEEDPPPLVGFFEARQLAARLRAGRARIRLRRWLALAQKAGAFFVPSARLAPDGASQQPGYGFHLVSIGPERTEALVAAKGGATVNDILLAALHLAIAGWNDDHATPCGSVGVLVPANLRPQEWRQDIVGNFSLPARIGTTRRSRTTTRRALEAVTAQTRRKKRTGMGTALVEVLTRSHLLPLWGKQVLVALLPVSGDRFVDTAMLSNLGLLDPLPRFGADAGATTEMWFSPPARMPLGLTIGALTAGGRLHLSFRYRHRLFDADAASRFAARFLAELDELIEVGPPAR